MQSKFKYYLVAFLVVTVWGSTFVSTKLLLLNGLSPAHIFTLRFIIAYILLLAVSLSRRGHRWLATNAKDELLMLGLGVTGGSLYFLTENAAMNYHQHIAHRMHVPPVCLAAHLPILPI